MKKVTLFLICMMLGACLAFISYTNSKPKNNYKEKLLRFHCIANSDSKSDQAVKLKVRDSILKLMTPKMSKIANKEDAIQYLTKNSSKVEMLANEVLKENHKNYTSKVVIGEHNFPVKTYGTITLPAGSYDAFRVILGKGEGKNWWCVMFPPLCFIDITRGVTTNETNAQLKRVLNNSEIETISTKNISNNKNNDFKKIYKKVSSQGKNKNLLQTNVKFKFKSVELVKSIINKIKN